MSFAHYSELDACVETETDWTGDHVIRRFVIVTMTDECCSRARSIAPGAVPCFPSSTGILLFRQCSPQCAELETVAGRVLARKLQMLPAEESPLPR